MRKLAAGNWKMNGTRASLSEVEAINAALDDTDPAVVICPPASLLIPACDIGGKIGIGAQDCHMDLLVRIRVIFRPVKLQIQAPHMSLSGIPNAERITVKQTT